MPKDDCEGVLEQHFIRTKDVLDKRLAEASAGQETFPKDDPTYVRLHDSLTVWLHAQLIAEQRRASIFNQKRKLQLITSVP